VKDCEHIKEAAHRINGSGNFEVGFFVCKACGFVLDLGVRKEEIGFEYWPTFYERTYLHFEKENLVWEEPPKIRIATSDAQWATSYSEPFKAVEWVVVPLPWIPVEPKVALVVPPTNPQEHYSSLHRPQFIPHLRKKTAAKTPEGQARFKEKMLPLWRQRKAQFDEYENKFRVKKHSDDALPPSKNLRCARCGGSVFTKEIVCRDCGQDMRRYERRNNSNQETAANHERKGHKKVRMTAEEALVGWLVTHSQGLRALSSENWSKVADAIDILSGEKVSRDVSQETGESLRAIESRCERIAGGLREYARGLKRRPLILDFEVFFLLEKLGMGDKAEWRSEFHPERRVQPLPRLRLKKTPPNQPLSY
jgi:hypothetical protein